MSLPQRLGKAYAFAVLLAGTRIVAQTHPSSDLEQVLSRVEANSEQYHLSVPSFICEEHIVSQELRDGKIKRETSVDASFSVTRSDSTSNVLVESREVRAVDGKPAAGKKVTLPLSFSGGFSGALTKFLSRDHRACFDYAAEGSARPPQGTSSFVFVARPSVAAEPECASIQPGTTGKFDVDTAAMQVTHIERTVPNPVGKDQSVLGTAAVDFAAVILNGRSFWLPTTITAFTTQTGKTDSGRFVARYSNYHRFASTSTLLPTDK